MIDRITIKNFKSFRDVTVNLGPMNIFIGPNASGKSNFFDALRVLQGIGYGFTLREILDGKPKSATSEVWDGIRGGSEETPFTSENRRDPTLFQVAGTLSEEDGGHFEFMISFLARDGFLRKERLSMSGAVVYEQEISEWPSPQQDCPSLTAIAHAPEARHHLGRAIPAQEVSQVLADMQRIAPSPALLRQYSKAYEMKRMGEQGENFAALVRMICADPQTKEAYLS